MNVTFLKWTPHMIAVVLCVAGRVCAQDITPAERQKALAYLGETQNAVAEAVRGLSDAQLTFKPAPDRWSVAEVMEHVALVEDLFTNNIREQLLKAPVTTAANNAKQLDATVVAKSTDRTTKYRAPDPVAPTGRWNAQASLDHFAASRQQTVSYLKSTPDLRAHIVTHPAFGPLDGYEWVLAIAAHTERHTKQILEVKADPGFPRN